MARIIIGILFCMMSFSFIAEHVLVHKKVSSASIINDFDSSEDKNEPVKEKKDGYEEKFFTRQFPYISINCHTPFTQYSFNELLILSGFRSSLFTPPDLL